MDQSPVQVSEAGGKCHESHPASAFKRLRGVLESTGGASKMLGILVAYEAPMLWIGNESSDQKPAFVEAQPKELTPPPPLLQRPPPGQ